MPEQQTTPIGLHTRVVRSLEPLGAPVDDELVMLSMELGKYFSLNAVATAIWERVQSPIEVAALCRDLEQTFDVTPEQCERDVLRFLRDLQGRRLVKVQD